jgi:hypothetical protein
MRSHFATIRLLPLLGGAYTCLRLCVCVPTPMPPQALRRLCDLLSLASGERGQFVLSVDAQAAAWSDSWVASILELPARHAQTRFILRRRKSRRE